MGILQFDFLLETFDGIAPLLPFLIRQFEAPFQQVLGYQITDGVQILVGKLPGKQLQQFHLQVGKWRLDACIHVAIFMVKVTGFLN